VCVCVCVYIYVCVYICVCVCVCVKFVLFSFIYSCIILNCPTLFSSCWNFSFIKPRYANLIYNKRFFCLLLHVSAELRNLQGFFTPILKTDHAWYITIVITVNTWYLY
jgi:hypothetical protein